MRALFILFIFGYILSAQNSDIYKRPFQSKPDFDIDVLHYDINLKINDHEKTFYGKTSIDFKVLKSKIDTVRFDTETYRVTSVKNDTVSLSFIQANGSVMIAPTSPIYRDEKRKYTIHYQSDGKIADPANYNMGGVRVLGLGFFDESEEVIFRSFSQLIKNTGKKYYPSRGKSILSVISKIKSNKLQKVTLGGCIIEKINETILITKEY